MRRLESPLLGSSASKHETAAEEVGKFPPTIAVVADSLPTPKAKRKLPKPILNLHEILTGAPRREIFQAYTTRWFVLFVCSLLSFNHNFLWLTFASIPNETASYFGVCDNTSSLINDTSCVSEYIETDIDLFVILSPMFSIVGLPIVVFTSRASASARRLIYWAGSLSFVGATLRALPSTPLLSPTIPGVLYIVHVGQVLNGVVGPFMLSTPALMSATWFPHDERSTATSCILGGGFLGAAIAYILPMVVNEASDVGNTLLAQFALCLFGFLAMFCVPIAPPTPPSGTAHIDIAGLTCRMHCQKVVADFRNILKDSAAAPLALVCGLWLGFYNSWLSLVSVPSSLEASQSWEQYVCWIISALSLATGAIAIGPIVDRSSLFSRKWKSVLVLLTAISAVLIAAEALLLSKDSLVTVSVPDYVGALVVAMAGICVGARIPIVYELIAETTHPLPTVMGGIFVAFWSSVGFVISVVAQVYVQNEMLFSLIFAALIAMTGGILGVMRVRYLRKNVDEACSLLVV